MSSDTGLSFAAQQARRHDRERFTTALFAPPHRREPLMALYAFNAEVARVRDQVNESIAGMIRLQWWREALAGEREAEAAANPVASALLAGCRAEKVTGAEFETLLETRERDLSSEPMADMAQLEAYAEGTAATITRLAVELLGVRDGDTLAAARGVGMAYALVGLMRAVPYHTAAGRLYLPETVLAQAGTSGADMLSGQAPRPAIAAAVRAVAERARHLLADSRRHRVDRRAVAALLPGTIAAAHLDTLDRAGFDPFDASVPRPKPMPIRLAFNALRGRF